jgi:hypothetical protein
MNYTLEELQKFRKMLENLFADEGSKIRQIAVNEWLKRKKSTIDCLIYGLQLKINELIFELEEKEKAEKYNKEEDGRKDK